MSRDTPPTHSLSCPEREFLKVECVDDWVCSNSPKKVLAMNSDTWFPERLVSDSCVSSRFSILLNCVDKHRETNGGSVQLRQTGKLELEVNSQIFMYT